MNDIEPRHPLHANSADGARANFRLPAPTDVEQRTTSVRTVLITLVIGAVVLVALVLGIGAAVVAVSQTEQGLCGRTAVPCASLSAERVAVLSGVALPKGATVLTATSGAATGDAKLTQLRAEVLLPADSTSPLAVGGNAPTTENCPEPSAIPLTEVTCYFSSDSSKNTSFRASEGTRDDGRTVLVFDVVTAG